MTHNVSASENKSVNESVFMYSIASDVCHEFIYRYIYNTNKRAGGEHRAIHQGQEYQDARPLLRSDRLALLSHYI